MCEKEDLQARSAPFVRGEFGNTCHDPVALLGFLGSAFVSKVRGWKELGGGLDDDVAIFTKGDSPLKKDCQ